VDVTQLVSGTAPSGAQARTWDVAAIRREFPYFRDPQAAVYLDSAATSQKPQAVLDALEHHLTRAANVHRGVYRLAEEATAAYEDARRRVARFIGATSPAEIVFTRGTTEAINLVAQSWGRSRCGAGDAIVLTVMEHHANIVPWQILAAERGVELRFVPVTPEGELDLAGYEQLLADGRVKLVGVTHVSNVLGTVNPIAEIAKLAHAAGALVLVDASQSVPHKPIDVAALGADFFAFTGHKALGPTGIGALWARRELLEAMPPWMGGGEMIREVKLEGSKWNDVPWKFEAGTMPIAEAIAFGAAFDWLENHDRTAIWEHDRALAAHALERLSEVPDLRVLGPPAERRGALVAFTLGKLHPHDVAMVLDSCGVAVRAGHHCAMPLHEHFGVPASVRASFHVYSSPDDVDALVRGLHRAREVFA
jgi:cysteine desulfurase/selenocysteine lyase